MTPTVNYQKISLISTRQIVFLVQFFTGLFLVLPAAKAQGDLFINPKRIVFENQKRSEEVSLANTGNDSARYVISFVQIRLKENGTFEHIVEPDSGQFFADKNIRVFPRTVILGPKETQVIKVQTYQKENLAAGEYRSHLYFRALPREKTSAEKAKKVDSGQVSIRLTAVFGITIPVIIRVGENTMEADISEVKLLPAVADQAAAISLRINRKGNMSAYGDIIVNYISPSGKTIRVGLVKGLSVYTPNAYRNVRIVLGNYKNSDFRGGQFQLSYGGIKGGKPVNFASATLNL